MPIVDSIARLPLFAGIPEDRLRNFVSGFRSFLRPAGSVLFSRGDIATHFEILLAGEVTLEESPSTYFDLRPVATIGELGALTGLARNTTAIAATEIQLLSIPVRDLLGFFDTNSDIGFAFYKNLLGFVSDKVRRDRLRMEEMRTNLIATQHAMKEMRGRILDAFETELSKLLFELLDQRIDNNRRVNYRVSPPDAYPCSFALDNGEKLRVVELREGYLKIASSSASPKLAGDVVSGILAMPTGDILVSGSIISSDNDSDVLKLDPLVEEFREKLEDYAVRVQLLDYVV